MWNKPSDSERIDAVTTWLDATNIAYDLYFHPASPTIELAKRHWRDDGSKHCKNLFFRNHKGNRHYLVCFDCDRTLSIHDLEARLHQGKLSFASPARIAIASDHGGFEQKQALTAYIADELGFDVTDMGPDTDASVDYPDYAAPVAKAVSAGEADRGVLVCGTGIGMAVAADKVAGVRASSITSVPFAELFRQHNNGNVVCLSGRFVDLEVNKEIVKTFLTTEFEGGRHEARVAKIMALD